MSATWTATVDEVVWTATDFPTVTFETFIRTGTTEVGGGVTDHGALTGLADDDHTQYAKADGTRGSFATVAQGALADTALQSGSGSNTANGWLKLDGSATIPDILIPASIARDSEVTAAADAAQAAAIAASQPLDGDLTAIAAVAGQTAYGRSLLTLADRPALVVAASGFTEIARHVTVSTNDWPTFTSVPIADWYRLRWFREAGTPSASGGTVRNLVLTLDGDSTSGNYFNTATSATSIAVQAFGQGGGGFGQLLLRRVQFTSTVHGAVVHADAVTAASGGSSAKASSAHSYRKAAGGVPDLSSWAIAASNNDTWAAGWTFILETGVDP